MRPATRARSTRSPPASSRGLWRNEHVPAYRCPDSHPYLQDRDYAPFASPIIPGVEVIGLGPVGVTIANSISRGLGDHWLATGAQTGRHNSSATNWTAGTNRYRIRLHCTKSEERGWGGSR